MNVYSLLDEMQAPRVTKAYAEKMFHPVPDAECIKRYDYLLERARGKVILDVGCTGSFSPELAKAAKTYYGLDREKVDLPNTLEVDLDTCPALPPYPGLELVFASEILEHLTDAGHFLSLLKDYACPIIVTVPNAFSKASQAYMAQGIECVNPEHVSWYSYHTLKTLVERLGYCIIDWKWYNGEPLTAEGLLFEIKAQHGANQKEPTR